MLEIKPRPSLILGKNCTNWATCLALKASLGCQQPLTFPRWSCTRGRVGTLGVELWHYLYKGYWVTVTSFHQCQLLQAVIATWFSYLLSTFWEIRLTVNLSTDGRSLLSVQLANQIYWLISFSDVKSKMQPPLSLSVYRTSSSILNCRFYKGSHVHVLLKICQ